MTANDGNKTTKKVKVCTSGEDALQKLDAILTGPIIEDFLVSTVRV